MPWSRVPPLETLRFAALIAAAGALGWLMVSVVSAAAAGPHPWLNHDNATNLVTTIAVLDGARLYTDCMVNNPPPIYFLDAAAVLASRAADLPLVGAYHAAVLLLAAVGFLVLWRSLPWQEDALGALAASLAYVAVASRGNFEVYDFGQREHVFALLFVPYLFWRALGPRPGAGMSVYLVVLGFFAVMKPQFAVLLVSTEWFLRERHRSSRTRIWSALGVGLALPIALQAIHSLDSFYTMMTDVAGFNLGAYSAYGGDYVRFLTSFDHGLMVAAAVLLVLGLRVARSRCGLPAGVVPAFASAPLLAYLGIVSQQKFWSYHDAVVFALLGVLVAFVWGRVVGSLEAGRARAVATGVLLGILVGGWALSAVHVRAQVASEQPPLIMQIAPALEGRERLLFFSPVVDFAYLPLYRGRPAVGCWAANFELVALASLPDPAARREALTAYAARMGALIDAEQPDAIVFWPRLWPMPRGATVHDVLVNEFGLLPRPGYVAARGPQLRSRVHGDSRWRIYLREDAPPDDPT